MKLIDLLKVTDESTSLVVSIQVHGMRFETEHTASFFLCSGDELNERRISKMFCVGDAIHVQIESEVKENVKNDLPGVSEN